MIVPSPFKNSQVKERFYQIFREDSEAAINKIMQLAKIYASCKDYDGEIKIEEVYGEDGRKVGAVELEMGEEKPILLPYSTLQKRKI